jgi:hypothetical protein
MRPAWKRKTGSGLILNFFTNSDSSFSVNPAAGSLCLLRLKLLRSGPSNLETKDDAGRQAQIVLVGAEK